MAVAEHEIDEAAAEAGDQSAPKRRMKSKHLDEEGYAAVQAAFAEIVRSTGVKRRRSV